MTATQGPPATGGPLAQCWLAGSLAFALGASSCARSGGETSDGGGPSSDASIGADAGLPSGSSSDGAVFAFDSDISLQDAAFGSGSITISPNDPTVVVTMVDGVVSTQNVSFVATSGGTALRVGWSVDQGGIATITPAGVFTATGAAGGLVKVIAGYGGRTVSTTVTVVVERTQHGFTGPVDLTTPGGYGGVGGEGPGPPPSPDATAALQQTPQTDPSQVFLYPYDKTVWPRGLLSPLLQWTPGKTDASAVAIHLESKTFVYDGYFGRPAALAASAPFVRHPIPQDVWQQATESTSGTDTLALRLVLLDGGQPVGPLTQSWTIAPGILEGTVYYESYGTGLVQNSDFQAQGGGYVGAAVLAIKPGDTGPHIAAGTNTPTATLGSGAGCRACHSVAAGGSSLIVEDDKYPYSQSSLYNLKTLGETLVNAPPPSSPPYPLSWAALSPDGTYALTNAVWMGTDTDKQTELYRIAGGVATPVTVSGLPPGVVGATPAFSPDGAHVAFTHVAGTLGSITGDGSHVVTLGFDANGPAGPTMSAPKNVFALPAGASDCVGFPSFLPTNDALLVELMLLPCGTGSTEGNTSFGQYVGTSKASGKPSLPSEIWWTDLATATQHRLDALNGYSPSGAPYLPVGPNNHGADTTLNYEPTVNPVSSGGYAWVIFTSRRLYGNVATIDPFDSDPRYYDYAHQVTTKKLWVAAIDLHAPPGTDPSHPAFYLPAQELQAGNARGFWVLDPCRADGMGCTAGDQCCGGYCQPSSDGGSLACGTTTTTCAQLGDKCVSGASCCNVAAECINGFCSVGKPQ